MTSGVIPIRYLVNKMKQVQKSDLYVKILYIVIFAALFLIFGYANKILFFRQSHWYEYIEGERIKYYSDINMYIDLAQGKEVDYAYTYPLYFKFSRLLMIFCDANNAVALAVLILNMLCVPVLTVFFWKSVGKTDNILYKIAALGLPYMMLLSSMLWMPGGNVPYGIEHRYLGVFTPNPWHNQTYFAARPFTIIAFLFFLRMICHYEEKADVRDYIIFSVTLLLATMTKPSFTIVLGSAALMFMLVRLVFHRFKTIKNTFFFGLTFIPTIINLCIQYSGIFGNNREDAEEGIRFAVLEIWSHYSKNISLSLALALAFPIIVLLFNLRAFIENRPYRFAWEFLLAGTLEFMFLKETGERSGHANFCWGYMYGIFFIFLISAGLLVRNTAEKKNRIPALAIQWAVLFSHVICGCIYFVYLLKGGNYSSF